MEAIISGTSVSSVRLARRARFRSSAGTRGSLYTTWGGNSKSWRPPNRGAGRGGAHGARRGRGGKGGTNRPPPPRGGGRGGGAVRHRPPDTAGGIEIRAQ